RTELLGGELHLRQEGLAAVERDRKEDLLTAEGAFGGLPVIASVIPGHAHHSILVDGQRRSPGIRRRVTRMIGTNRIRPSLAGVVGVTDMHPLETGADAEMVDAAGQ